MESSGTPSWLEAFPVNPGQPRNDSRYHFDQESTLRIAIATVQIPFLSGGAEALADGLRHALLHAGHVADIVSMPFRFFPEPQIARAIRVWESEDFTALNLYEPDLVICLKFPAFYLAHPLKRAWILHQFRDAYDLYDPSGKHALSEETRLLIKQCDTAHLSQCQHRFALSLTVANRLRHFNGLIAKPLYHPPPAAERFYSAPPQPYVFAPSRLESLKRQDLLIESMRYVKAPIWAIIAGMGGQYGRLNEMVHHYDLGQRVRLIGQLSPEELRAFYANCLAVFFGPKDEDYGYVTLESMLAAKPVITCHDSGGPLEFITHEVNGLVVAPEPQAIADAIDRLAAHRNRSIELGRNGQAQYQAMALSWDHVVSTLIS